MAKIKALKQQDPATRDHIIRYLQGLLARAYKQDVLQIEIRLLTQEGGWDEIKLK